MHIDFDLSQIARASSAQEIVRHERQKERSVAEKNTMVGGKQTANNSQSDAMPVWVLFTIWINRAKLIRIRSLGRHCAHLRYVAGNKMARMK
jgi:hypothetical protein